MSCSPSCSLSPLLRFCRPWPLALVLLLTAGGCPERSAAPPAPPPACTAFGQRCEFSPGKLGSCVQKDNCTGNDCFVCQSQH